MDIKQINDALDRIFHEEHARIVFWNDPQQEFLSTLPFLMLDDVNVLKLDDLGALETKIRLERDDPSGRYLLYSPQEEPEFDDDWLLDIRLYSRSFRADRASILLDQLGLVQQRLRGHVALRRKFFDNRERVQKLRGLVEPDDNELDLDRKMLAVATRADQPELFNIIRTLFHSMTEGEEVDLDVVPPTWEQVEKFELDQPFWGMVKTAFGYESDSPNLKSLLIRLMVADYLHHLGKEAPPALRPLTLSRSGTANAVVCLAQWRDSGSKGTSYDHLAAQVAAAIKLPELLTSLELDDLIDVTTFPDIEKVVVTGLLERVMGAPETLDAVAIRSIAGRRQAGHWVASPSIPEPQRRARHAVYEAIAVAAEFLALKRKHTAGFDYPDAGAMYHGYCEELYRFDQLYRLFYEHADVAAAHGWDMLKPLRDEVEAVYCNTYLTRLGLTWGKFVGSGLLDKWFMGRVPNAHDFFERMVRPRLDEGNRAFVVISDALRYEAAQELTFLLNGRYRMQADLASQLAVLPSYTALGMASLLPHKALEYKPNGDVVVDGKPTSSLEQRSEILKSVNGIAVKADALIDLKKEEGRELLSGCQVVYVYHDRIDSAGDKQATEGDTFQATRKAIQELADLVRYIINNLNGNYVVVTADHGFVYTETARSEVDKSKLNDKPPGTVRAKKRYLLGHDLPDCDEAWHGKTQVTAKALGNMEFWIPRGYNLFHFVGGARFVHGGTMLQEVVVPVVTVRHLKDKGAREKTRTKYVTVQVLGTKHKITTPKHRFNLIQMEPASDRAKPITLKVAVYLGDEPVTSIETMTFDSTSPNLDDRQKQVILTLQDRQYDKKAAYRLVLRDAETGIEQQSVDVIIDRAISDDFDF